VEGKEDDEHDDASVETLRCGGCEKETKIER
jgi:hypothetical protein